MKSKNNEQNSELSSDINYLLSPEAIREQSRAVLEAAVRGETHFQFHPDRMEETVDYVLKVIRKNYPSLDVPFHSRWGHFRVGGVDRVQWLDQKLAQLSDLERARIKFDLVIPSVLLDAGAGAAWKFNEKETSKSFSRSEGLGVASFHLFLSGNLSSDRKSIRTDQLGLSRIQTQEIDAAFQVSETNPLVGVEGRTHLLRNLATALQNTTFFHEGRPGNLVDYLHGLYGKTIPAPKILRAVLDSLGPIWPGRITLNETNLGDVWQHSKLGLIPFHKLSQWMTYSLIEPLIEAGFKVTDIEKLTGLAEYRNGGLMIDSGLLSFQNPRDQQATWAPQSDLIIEWRALTLALLDQIGTQVQNKLGLTPQQFPLAKVLEGGTWWAGRFLAQEKRAGGTPPLSIQSDGTVF